MRTFANAAYFFEQILYSDRELIITMEINFERVTKLLKKNIVMIIAVSVISTILACIISVFFIKPQYTTGSRFKIALTQDMNQKVDTITYTARLLSLVNEVTGSFNSDTFYKMISDKVAESGLKIDPKDIVGMLSITLEGDDTTYFTIKVTSGSASQAKIVSDAVYDVSVEYLAGIDKNYTLVPMRQGQLPKSPSSPNVSRNAAIGLFVGAFAAVLYLIVADMMDRRVKTTADLVERFGFPILGIVPQFNIEDTKDSSSDGKDGIK